MIELSVGAGLITVLFVYAITAAGLAALALLPFASSTIALRLPLGGVYGTVTIVLLSGR